MLGLYFIAVSFSITSLRLQNKNLLLEEWERFVRIVIISIRKCIMPTYLPIWSLLNLTTNSSSCIRLSHFYQHLPNEWWPNVVRLYYFGSASNHLLNSTFFQNNKQLIQTYWLKLEVGGFNSCLLGAERIIKKCNWMYLLNFKLSFKEHFRIQNTVLTRMMQCEVSFVYLNNWIQYSTIRTQLDQIYVSWATVLTLWWHRLFLNSKSITSAKRVWSCFILTKSFFEDGKFELSDNTIMNLDFRVHLETIVAEVFPCVLTCIVELEIQLCNFRVVFKFPVPESSVVILKPQSPIFIVRQVFMLKNEPKKYILQKRRLAYFLLSSSKRKDLSIVPASWAGRTKSRSPLEVFILERKFALCSSKSSSPSYCWEKSNPRAEKKVEWIAQSERILWSLISGV